MAVKVNLISLGCPKNLVDSEEMLGSIKSAGYELVAEPESADVVVINTCGFIEAAKQESIETILDAVRLKSGGKCKAIVVAGCLSQRYGEELSEEIPEADAFLGVGKNADLPEVISQALSGTRLIDCNPPGSSWVDTARVRSTPPWTAYLRLADGCDNRCAYCAIPDIRGPFRSRPPDQILAEAQLMADEGVLEVSLVAQDITRYGQDIPGWSLERLLRDLAGIDGLFWIRLLYCYPTRITDGLIELVASEPKIVKYMDIPLQHGDDKMLTAMNRKGSREGYLEVIRKIREASSEIALRTSFIVGFPGEGEAEFENLLSFVEEIDFDRVGAFTYSIEDGTPASMMPNQVPKHVAARRYDKLMTLANKISDEHNNKFIGKEIDVLVESADSGRSYRDAPEIDGIVRLTGEPVVPGEMVRAVVTEAGDYDLTAKVTCRIMCSD